MQFKTDAPRVEPRISNDDAFPEPEAVYLINIARSLLHYIEIKFPLLRAGQVMTNYEKVITFQLFISGRQLSSSECV